LSKFSLLSTLKLLTDTFVVKQLHTCHVTHIKTSFFVKIQWPCNCAKDNKKTKLIEGGHRGLQDIRYYF